MVNPNNKHSGDFITFHQNIRGQTHKIDELLISLSDINPQVLCVTEHHLRPDEINSVHFWQYNLGTYFCRKLYKQGDVSIFVSKNIQFQKIDLNKYVKEKDFEVSALNLRVASINLLIICLYRSPTGDYTYFLNQLVLVLNKLYKVSTNIILCGDFNINFLESTSRIMLLESLLASYNLYSTIKFPTRNFINSHTLIDNIFININRFDFSATTLINGLSDHDAQIMALSDIMCSPPKQPPTYIRIIDNKSTRKFSELLSYENWEGVFQDMDVNLIFNSFKSTYLRIFYSSFPIGKKFEIIKPKPWITTGIKISCANKIIFNLQM